MTSAVEDLDRPAGGRLPALILGVVIATALVAQTDWSTIGLGAQGSVPAPIRLLSRAIPLGGLVVLLLVRRDLLSRLTSRPGGWLTALAVWTLVVAASTSAPLVELQRGLWFTSGVVVAIWAGARLGWLRVLGALAPVLAVFVVLGVVVEMTLGPYPTQPGFESGDGLFGLRRFRGLTYAPNVLASYAATLVLAAAVPLIIGRRSRASMAMVVVGLAVLGLTQSRVALLSVVLGLALLEVRHSRSIRRVVILAAPLVVLALFAVVVRGGAVPSLSRSSESSDLTNLVGRTQLWGIASDLIAERPVTGHGEIAVESRFEGEVSDGYLGWNPVSSHNLLLNTWAAYGLVGVLLLAGLFAAMIRRTANSPPVGWETLLVVVLVLGITESVMEGVPTLEIVLLAVAAGSMSRSVRHGDRFDDPRAAETVDA